MSGAASTLHNINFAAAARGRCGVTHPRGSGDLRQRRHGFRLRLLPRVALWGQPAESGGVRPLGGATSAAASQPIPRQRNRHRATGNSSTLVKSIPWKET
jgi:hypothetical protein